ncbi:MAG: hypothetical protein HZA30_00725 [Candidatus Omnitrophica bacterium]|nr:hypothetical protein [Candidatus Omnitrophota bacterium]
MKYKTTIEIVTNAQDNNEAMEIVGEYLSGHLSSGVDMKCSTKRFSPYAKPIISVVALCLVFLIGILSVINVKPSKITIGNIAGINAVQPPLKTSSTIEKADFKKEWETKQTKEALKLIKNK